MSTPYTPSYITRILHFFGLYRRKSTKLSKSYTDCEVRRLRKCQAMFGAVA